MDVIIRREARGLTAAVLGPMKEKPGTKSTKEEGWLPQPQ